MMAATFDPVRSRVDEPLMEGDTKSSAQLKLRLEEVRNNSELAKLRFRRLDAAFLEAEERHLLVQELLTAQAVFARWRKRVVHNESLLGSSAMRAAAAASAAAVQLLHEQGLHEIMIDRRHRHRNHEHMHAHHTRAR